MAAAIQEKENPMKRARGKNKTEQRQSRQRYTYDDIDVPEMIRADKRPQRTAAASGRQKTAVKKKKKKKNKGKILLIILLALVAAFMFLMGRSLSGGDAEGALVPVDMEKGKLNVLLLGVDKEGLRTDAMMLVSYDLKNPGAKLLSIPRDTQIKVEDRNVTRKINEVHAMHDSDGKLIGPMGSIRAVEALTSVPIHYYVELNFDAIDELADIIGPIEFDVPDIEGKGRGMNYDDPVQDLHIHLKPGLQKLSGNQVQQFLRYRKSNNGTADGSDISRVQRQQDFLKAAIEQKVNVGLIAKIPSIYSKLKKNMKTNFSVGDAVKYSKYLKGLTSDALVSFSLPGESKRLKAWYFVCDLKETAELIQTEFEYDAQNLTNVINLSDLKGTKKVLTSSESGKKTDESSTSSDDDTADKATDTSKTEKPREESEEEAEEFSDYDEYEEKTETKAPATKKPEKTPVVVATPKPDSGNTAEKPNEEPEMSIAPAHTPPPAISQEPEQEEDDYIRLD